MKRRGKDPISTIGQALVEAHRSRPEVRVDDRWNRRVMARVRAEGRTAGEADWPALTQRFVWRFATAACTLAVAFSLYAFSKGITPDRIAGNLFLDDPVGISLVQISLL